MHLSIKNDLSEIKIIFDKVERYSKYVGIENTYNLNLLLEEVVSNIIRHSGNKSLINIFIEKLNGFIEIKFEYGGCYFDLKKYKTREINEDSVGDIGVCLIKNLASEIFYKRRKKTNKLTIYLPYSDNIKERRQNG